jgi:hypothetical protein
MGASFAMTNPVHAQDARITLRLTKAGFILGATGGGGTLTYQGRNYSFAIGGLSLGLTIGGSVAELRGNVYNMNRPSDLAGTYSALQASAAFGTGGNAIVLQNGNGVRLELEGTQTGLEASLDAGGMVITMD